jgi:hypothetical protein
MESWPAYPKMIFRLRHKMAQMRIRMDRWVENSEGNKKGTSSKKSMTMQARKRCAWFLISAFLP